MPGVRLRFDGGVRNGVPYALAKEMVRDETHFKGLCVHKGRVARGRTLLSRIGRGPREGRNQRVYVQKCPRYIVDGRPQMQKKGVAEMKMRIIRVGADQMPQP